ncbi:FolC bifunctional protein [Thalassoporum mexicanum PCC 7367]|uniref:bifunctional folylpolyglutamate synthase/dihydrofolate synthase n=1 Tax=Thalassoporum mexicanum TaxID=3457544 RepID=UPI00029FBCBE|nr:folylpolyglutamate synthase/dihydrofolate synthase family protein [Pseudanabaena sp. PCC 7367]AFY68503.1 FolC bifunctional protein [Pseudanabaena sp. PCC 7367]
MGAKNTANSANDFLARFQRFGIHLGLTRIKQLLDDLGNPQTQVPIVHVAGTNGKGSVCAYVASVLQAAGYKTGRYTSPHLIDWHERICINDRWISNHDLIAALEVVQSKIKPTTPEQTPTQFEVFTAAAWWYFAQQQVDIAVIETGLGGRLDATNVCDRPLVSVITSISMDHWQRLGNTLGQIAGEKAGIIKPNRPVVVGELPAEAAAVIAKQANDCQSPITWVEPARFINSAVYISEPSSSSSLGDRTIEPNNQTKQTNRADLNQANTISNSSSQNQSNQSSFAKLPMATWQDITYPLSLLGDYQLINSAIALATIQALQQQQWQIDEQAIQTGMAQTSWAGRLQWVDYQNRRLLIDGAHNLAAAKQLRQFCDRTFANQDRCWIMGILATKDYAGILKALVNKGDRLITLPIPGHQCVDPQELVAIGQPLLNTKPTLANNLEQALSIAVNQSALAMRSSEPIIICGSLYLVGEFLSNQRQQ